MAQYKHRVNKLLQGNQDVRKLTWDELAKVKKLYLDMLDDLYSCCNANDIDIALGGGSALGAVRHQGFIPWDDDIDVIISRVGFEHLKQVVNKWFHGKYTFQAPNYLPGNTLRMGKIENPEVTIEDYNGRVHGLEIDIFILENVPDNRILFYIHGFRSIFYTAVLGFVNDYTFARSALKSTTNASPVHTSLEQHIRRALGWCFSFLSAEKWANRLDNANQYPSDKTRNVGIPTGAGHFFKEVYERNSMKCKPVSFEGHQFTIPVGYNEYLHKLYGDYMRLPSEENREYHYIRSISFQNQ